MNESSNLHESDANGTEPSLCEHPDDFRVESIDNRLVFEER